MNPEQVEKDIYIDKGIDLYNRGDYQGAYVLFKQSLTTTRKAFGDTHVESAICLHTPSVPCNIPGRL